MAGWTGAFREDWTGAGFFGFQSTGVQYADTGITGLKQSIYWDQGPWFLVNTLGTATYSQTFDAVTSRVADVINPASVDGGPLTGSYWLYRRMRLPRDFGTWSIVSFFTQKDGATVADFLTATLTLYKNGVPDGALNAVNIMPVASADWEQQNEVPSGTYSPGDFITFGVNLTVNNARGAYLLIADLAATYVTRKGNV